MTSKKTKVILAAVVSALLITESSASFMMMHEIAHKNTEYKALEVKINTLTKQEEEDKKKNIQLEDYISINKELMKNAEETKKKDDELIHQNQELQKMNEILKQYKDTVTKTISRGGSPFKKLSVKKITVELSMYCATGKKTASGLWPKWGMVAAPPELPIGAGIIIDGYCNNKVFLIADRGGYIQKVGDVYRLDIYTEDSEAYANQFGRHRNVTAYVIVEE